LGFKGLAATGDVAVSAGQCPARLVPRSRARMVVVFMLSVLLFSA
jgi:hypothetical protein